MPGRVLRKWDFGKYYVSNFARDLLSKIAGDPLFNPNDINSGLYKKVRSLEAVRVSVRGEGGIVGREGLPRLIMETLST